MDANRQEILNSRISTTLFGAPHQGVATAALNTQSLQRRNDKDQEAAFKKTDPRHKETPTTKITTPSAF